MRKAKVPEINWKKTKKGRRVVNFLPHDTFIKEVEKTMNSISFLRKQLS